MDTFPPLTFATWVPAALREEAERLYAKLTTEKNSTEAFKSLSRLVSDARMQGVWRELYKKKRLNDQATNEFVHPACVTSASKAAVQRQQARELRKKGGAKNESDAKSWEAAAALLESEAALLENEGDPAADSKWSEQDRAAQHFFNHVYRAALDSVPVFLSDIHAKIEKLRRVAESLEKQAAKLESLGMNAKAQSLREVASNCDDEAGNLDSRRLEPGDDPWIIARNRKDPKVRALVADLFIAARMCFGSSLYGTLATVANVVLSRDDMTGPKVREMLRVAPGV